MVWRLRRSEQGRSLVRDVAGAWVAEAAAEDPGSLIRSLSGLPAQTRRVLADKLQEGFELRDEMLMENQLARLVSAYANGNGRFRPERLAAGLFFRPIRAAGELLWKAA
jgi:hypothetical protein